MTLIQYTRVIKPKFTNMQVVPRGRAAAPQLPGSHFASPNSNTERALDRDKLNHKHASRYRRLPMISSP